MKIRAVKLAAGLMAVLIFAGSIPTAADGGLNTESPAAGMAVAMNNFDASNPAANGDISGILNDVVTEQDLLAELAAQETEEETTVEETVAAVPSPYADIAIAQVVDAENGYVNVRTEANTTSEIVGKIYNNCAATILETVEGEDGSWYRIQSGSVEGFIKSEFFITGEDAEEIAEEIGVKTATVIAPALKLREDPSLDENVKIVALLPETEDVSYIIDGVSEDGLWVHIVVDDVTSGYVYRDCVTESIRFKEAVSLEEEAAAIAEREEREREYQEAQAAYEASQQSDAAAQQAAAAQAAAEEAARQAAAAQAAAEEAARQAAAQQAAAEAAAQQAAAEEAARQAAAQQAAAEEAARQAAAAAEAERQRQAAEQAANNTSELRAALCAFAVQFVGNPYVWGGTSLTNGADCSGFVLAVYAQYGISLPHYSAAQAGCGTAISLDQVQPGDLVFYSNNGSTINHVGIYIGNGQIVHAVNESYGIQIWSMYYKQPCAATRLLP